MKKIRFEHVTEHETIALQVAPMVDIVLFLICFFMLASEMVQGQKDRSVELPYMKSPLSAVETRAEIIVNLRPDGAVAVEGENLSLDSLAGLLAGESQRAHSRGRPLRVVVRADRRQRFAALDDVLGACRRAGLEQVVFRATGEEGA
jgi:biopolymer transport protein ExbD